MITASRIPNLITLARLIGCGIFPIIFSNDYFFAALILYGLMECGDQLDGKLATWFKWKSQVGQFFDPFVDSLTHLTAFACLIQEGWVPLWIYFIFLFREFGLFFVRLLASLQGIELPGHMAGKLKALVHAMAIFFSLWTLAFESHILFEPRIWIGVAALASVASGIFYGIIYAPIIRRAFQR